MKKIGMFLVGAALLTSFVSCGDEFAKEKKSSNWFMAQTTVAAVESVSASSELVETQYAGNYLYSPVNVIDGNFENVWCESTEGSGIGETITIEFSEAVSFDEIQVVNGFASSKHPTYYKINNRVKTIELTEVADKHKLTGEYSFVDNTEDWQSVKFPYPRTAQILELKIKDVYRGEKYDDTCFDEIRFLFEGKVIPFQNVASIQEVQRANSKDMLGNEFYDKFEGLFKQLKDGKYLVLKQAGKTEGVLMTAVGSGNSFEVVNYFPIYYLSNSECYYMPTSYDVTLGNCRVTLRDSWSGIKTTKLIRIDGKSVEINGVHYSVVNPSKLSFYNGGGERGSWYGY